MLVMSTVASFRYKPKMNEVAQSHTFLGAKMCICCKHALKLVWCFNSTQNGLLSFTKAAHSAPVASISVTVADDIGSQGVV